MHGVYFSFKNRCEKKCLLKLITAVFFLTFDIPRKIEKAAHSLIDFNG